MATIVGSELGQVFIIWNSPIVILTARVAGVWFTTAYMPWLFHLLDTLRFEAIVLVFTL